MAALHVTQPQKAEFFAPDTVIEQRGKNGAIPQPLRVSVGGASRSRLAWASPRAGGVAFVIVRHRALETIHRVAEEGIAITEIVKERR